MITPCDVCGNVDLNWDRDWAVSEEEWRQVVPERWRDATLCPWCFVKFAAERGKRYKVAYYPWAPEISMGVKKVEGERRMALDDMRRELQGKFEKLRRFESYSSTNPQEDEMIEEWKSIIRDLTGRLPPELKVETKRGGWTATYYPPDMIRFRPDVWEKLTLDEKRLTVLHELFHYFDIPRRVDLRHFEFAPVVNVVLRKLDYPIPEEYQRKAEKIIRILRGEV